MKRVLISLINIYQKLPLSSHSYCRFTPTCSEYMKIAIERYGTFKGVKMGLKRISKCRPGKHFGYDPVPEEEKI